MTAKTMTLLFLLSVSLSASVPRQQRFQKPLGSRHFSSLENMPVIVEEPDPEDNGPDVNWAVDDVLDPSDLQINHSDGLGKLFSRFRIHTYGRTWLEAVTACWREGGRLATPGDAAEAHQLGRLLKATVTAANITNTEMKDAMHVGVHSLSNEDSWITLDGDSVKNSSWLGFNLDFIAFKRHMLRCGAIMDTGRFLYQGCGECLIYACDMQWKKKPANSGPTRDEQDTEYVVIGDPRRRRRYRLHASPLPWLAAGAACEAEGALLAVPLPVHTMAGRVAEAVFAPEQLPAEVRRSGVFVGITDLPEEGSWGNVLDMFIQIDDNWATGRPSHNRSANCGVMMPSGHFADVPCNDQKPFLCEKAEEIDDRAEYVRIDGFGPFGFHVSPLSWIDAVLKCQSENATLAVPQSKEEVAAMIKLQKEVLAKKGLGYNGDVIYVGVHDLDGDRRWRTVDGKKVLKSDGIQWSRYSHSFSRVTCAFLKEEGKYGNIFCEFTAMFICKKI